jgi:23S rRNA (cytosine1962-C5)-methyltransferase
MLREAAAAAGRDARVLTLRGAGPDHPVALECPETRYLKVAVLQVR